MLRISSVLLLVLSLSQHDAASDSKQKVKAEMDNQIINNRKFGDYGNRSALPFTVALQGDVLWPDNPIKMGEICRNTPVHLALWQNVVVADCGSEFIVLEKSTGNLQWRQTKYDNAEFDLSEKGIVKISHAARYEVVGLDGKVKECIPLPAFLDNSRLLSCNVTGDDVFYLFNYAGSKYVSPGSSPASVNFTFEHMNKESQVSMWSRVWRQEVARWVCFSSDKSMVHIASENNLYSFPAVVEDDQMVKVRPFTSIEGLSLNHDDEVLVIEKTEKGRFLHLIDQSNIKMQTIELDRIGIIIQPAASTPDGVIFIAAGKVLYCIDNGNEVWRHPFDSAQKPILFSVLSDKSVISVSGHSVFVTDSEGKLVFEKFVIPEISCRPVVDSDGSCYLGGKNGVVCLR
ncbi:MAG: hypothetical protein JW863_01160 [Chitinispirillaceae bacterium]|nr:hypothetical protein [Chitinispirillaceae bacterium]